MLSGGGWSIVGGGWFGGVASFVGSDSSCGSFVGESVIASTSISVASSTPNLACSCSCNFRSGSNSRSRGFLERMHMKSKLPQRQTPNKAIISHTHHRSLAVVELDSGVAASAVTFCLVGDAVGSVLGTVDGDSVGLFEGTGVGLIEGLAVGPDEGEAEGLGVGADDGIGVVGWREGEFEGVPNVGDLTGADVGRAVDGDFVGFNVVGFLVG